jgi:hypothetical protein
VGIGVSLRRYRLARVALDLLLHQLEYRAVVKAYIVPNIDYDNLAHQKQVRLKRATHYHFALGVTRLHANPRIAEAQVLEARHELQYVNGISRIAGLSLGLIHRSAWGKCELRP